MFVLAQFFIIAAFSLLLLEIILSSGGLLAFSGIVSFIIGFLVLFYFKSCIPSYFYYAVLPLFIALSILSIIIVVLGYKAQKRKLEINTDEIIGKTGVCIKPICNNRAGQIKVDGEIWKAFSSEGDIKKGEIVTVVGRDSLKLKIKKGAE